MNNFVYDLVLSPKLMILMLANGIGSYAVEFFLKYDAFIVKASATVSFIMLIIMAVARYCKMINDNRAAREATRMNELELEEKKLEIELLRKKIDGDKNDA